MVTGGCHFADAFCRELGLKLNKLHPWEGIGGIAVVCQKSPAKAFPSQSLFRLLVGQMLLTQSIWQLELRSQMAMLFEALVLSLSECWIYPKRVWKPSAVEEKDLCLRKKAEDQEGHSDIWMNLQLFNGQIPWCHTPATSQVHLLWMSHTQLAATGPRRPCITVMSWIWG